MKGETINKTKQAVESMLVETILNGLGAKWEVFEAQSGKKVTCPNKNKVAYKKMLISSTQS